MTKILLTVFFYLSVISVFSQPMTAGVSISTSIANVDAETVGFPRDTILVTASIVPPIGKITAFEREYLQATVRAAKAAGLDGSQIVVPILPFASFESEIYADASQRYAGPISTLVDAEGQKFLLVTLTPARLVMLITDRALATGLPMVLNSSTLNNLSEKWAHNVLPKSRSRDIKNFSSELPDHLSFLPTLLGNSGGGGPFPFAEAFTSHTEQCLWESLPYYEALLAKIISTLEMSDAMSLQAIVQSSEMDALRPACLQS